MIVSKTKSYLIFCGKIINRKTGNQGTMAKAYSSNHRTPKCPLMITKKNRKQIAK